MSRSGLVKAVDVIFVVKKLTSIFFSSSIHSFTIHFNEFKSSNFIVFNKVLLNRISKSYFDDITFK